ncbi:hypothetical protein BHE90_014089 [Fusarium euwallaceae]|uniref:Uncharacterized protein n=4 Tax=Fusarium solani species complex TaxID=232080 RepID=A0A3M2RQM8_9HYPO|nr:hypothetical protein CDV36_012772 [Fusarium kuroshium]RSL58532.1 hypothetical protein CEP51_014067 [Fusarium floridanum]RTE71518.1 hypothetical protein BHE90_014089 [Fusarium euwallaceae]
MSATSLLAIQRTIREDPHNIGSRPSFNTVNHSGQLTSCEKIGLGDLFEAYIKIPGRSSKLPPILSELYKEFVGHIFNSWVSAQTTNLKPILPPRPSHQKRIEVGASQAGRSFDEMMHGSIFLTMDFDSRDGSFDWTWHNGDNIPITANIEYRLPRGVSKKDAMIMAIENYDNIERERITSHNRVQIISAARRRITKWAQAGSDLQAEVDNEDKLKDGDILPLVLASDMFIKTAREGADVAAALKTRRGER